MKASWSALLMISLSPKLCWGPQLATMPCRREICTNTCPVPRITVPIKASADSRTVNHHGSAALLCLQQSLSEYDVPIFHQRQKLSTEGFTQNTVILPDKERLHAVILSPCNGNNCPAEPEPELEGERQGLPTFRSSFGEWASYLLTFFVETVFVDSELYLWSVGTTRQIGLKVSI